MAEDLYRCSCGKGFRTAQGLAGHKRFCKKANHQPRAEESVGGLLQRLSGLEEDCEALSQLHSNSLERLNDLERLVGRLVQYVYPAGVNLVGVHSGRIREISAQLSVLKSESSAQLSALKSEMDTSQGKLEREIKGWVWNVIPERFRPRL